MVNGSDIVNKIKSSLKTAWVVLKDFVNKILCHKELISLLLAAFSFVISVLYFNFSPDIPLKMGILICVLSICSYALILFGNIQSRRKKIILGVIFIMISFSVGSTLVTLSLPKVQHLYVNLVDNITELPIKKGECTRNSVTILYDSEVPIDIWAKTGHPLPGIVVKLEDKSLANLWYRRVEVIQPFSPYTANAAVCIDDEQIAKSEYKSKKVPIGMDIAVKVSKIYGYGGLTTSALFSGILAFLFYFYKFVNNGHAVG